MLGTDLWGDGRRVMEEGRGEARELWAPELHVGPISIVGCGLLGDVEVPVLPGVGTHP